MVLLTGDIHGHTEKIINAIHRFHLTSEDVIIILGDAGLNFWGRHGDKNRKKDLNQENVQIFCIHGNHEMRPYTLPSYHERLWNGGNVYIEDEFPNLLFAKDGEIYNFNGLNAIAIGGAYSVDKWYRIANGSKWFADEQPSENIKRYVEAQLDKIGWNIDFVLSHTCPMRYTPVEAFLPGIDQLKVDKTTEEWLDSIAERLNYKHWYCGHWHIDKHMENFSFLMDGFETF